MLIHLPDGLLVSHEPIANVERLNASGARLSGARLSETLVASWGAVSPAPLPERSLAARVWRHVAGAPLVARKIGKASCAATIFMGST